MPRTNSSLSDDETLCYSEAEISNTATNKCNACDADDTDLVVFRQHVETFEKECCEELSDYDDWAPDEKIHMRKLKGTRLVDADIDLWRLRKTERHAGSITTPKKRARARSFREKRVALLSHSSDSECHADDESDDVPSTLVNAETEQRELVPIVQAHEDVHPKDRRRSRGFGNSLEKISTAESQFSTPRISSSKLQQYRRNSTAQLL